jgi:hypothetical protein
MKTQKQTLFKISCLILDLTHVLRDQGSSNEILLGSVSRNVTINLKMKRFHPQSEVSVTIFTQMQDDFNLRQFPNKTQSVMGKNIYQNRMTPQK